MASVIKRLGNRSMNASLTGAENKAAVLARAIQEDKSKSEISVSVAVSTRVGPSRRRNHDGIYPLLRYQLKYAPRIKLWNQDNGVTNKTSPITPHWVAPCISGAIGNMTIPVGLAFPFSTISSGVVTR